MRDSPPRYWPKHPLLQLFAGRGSRVTRLSRDQILVPICRELQTNLVGARRVTARATDPRFGPLPLAIPVGYEPGLARDIRTPPPAFSGSPAADFARQHAHPLDPDDAGLAPARDHGRRGKPARKRIASSVPTRLPRTSSCTRCIDGSFRSVGPAKAGGGHDLAAASRLFTPRGGSRSCREVDPDYVAAEAQSCCGATTARLL